MPDRTKCEATLGADLGGVYFSLYESFVVMGLEWRVFSEWFRAAPERVDLLNEVSGTTALVIQNALRERTAIKLSRLTDRSSQGRNRNASLAALRNYEVTENDAILQQNVLNAQEKASNIRRIRSKRLVHADHRETLFPSDDLGASYADFDAAIKASGAVLQHFSNVYLDAHVSFDMVSSFKDDEVSFLKVIYLGLIKRDEISSELREIKNVADYEREIDRVPDYLRRRFFVDMLS